MPRSKSPLKMVCPRETSAERRERIDFAKTMPAKHRKQWMKKGPCKWTCARSFKIAKFQSRYRADEYGLLHPSTKQPGKWQFSWFDADGPVGDRVGDCNKIAETISPREYKLVEWV